MYSDKDLGISLPQPYFLYSIGCGIKHTECIPEIRCKIKMVGQKYLRKETFLKRL